MARAELARSAPDVPLLQGVGHAPAEKQCEQPAAQFPVDSETPDRNRKAVPDAVPPDRRDSHPDTPIIAQADRGSSALRRLRRWGAVASETIRGSV